jgi:hypothetical protein
VYKESLSHTNPCPASSYIDWASFETGAPAYAPLRVREIVGVGVICAGVFLASVVILIVEKCILKKRNMHVELVVVKSARRRVLMRRFFDDDDD